MITEENISLALQLLPLQTWNTLYMVFTATFFAMLLGLPLGVILTITDKGHVKENPSLYKILETLVNIGRSFPFAILMVALIPFTQWIIGTSLGTTASIVPLTVAAFPFAARLVEASLKEVDRHIVEASIVMGSSTLQLIAKVLLPEALPSLILGVTLTLINLIGYSAMAGLVGGGGLGQVAMQYGYYRFNTFIMIVTVIVLILLVQLIQWLGGSLAKSIRKKRGILVYD
jgi:D-methionine transport system permease protein